MLKPHRSKRTQTLRGWLGGIAKDARAKAWGLPAGAERDDLLKRARRADTAAHLKDWTRRDYGRQSRSEGFWMQYRGIDMKIVRMGAPGGWKWTVTVDGEERSGSCQDREQAIGLAKKFIDRRLGPYKAIFSVRRPLPLVRAQAN